jgi:two-component system nitrogen regulation response regulator NtrX
MTEVILVADDEKNIRRALRMVLEGDGFEVMEAESAPQALATIHEHDIDLLILDVRMPGMSGIEALSELAKLPEADGLPVLVISGHATITDAVTAVQRGALDFLEKPLDRDRVLVTVRNALRTRRLERELRTLKRDARRYEMIGDSPAMRQLYSDIEKIAPTRGRVLITGESGTGKELVARALHRLSSRAEAAFIKVNCAAIPAELIESELFGHERGAFTGAVQRKKGLFEAADGGTLFLDEIGDMTLAAQAKVLRALQNGEITRVGSEQVITVDVRVIAATHRDLEDQVKKGAFREDLFFRLNVVPIHTPALRDRAADIPALARSFLDDFFKENGIRPKPVEPEVMEALERRPFPGNVRELKNVVERMGILSGDRITLADLPALGSLARESSPELSRESQPHLPSKREDAAQKEEVVDGASLREHRDRAEREYIEATLEKVGWNISRAADLLGVERTNLHKKMRSLGIKR